MKFSLDFLLVLASIALTAVCWGAYGPVLHRGQTEHQLAVLLPIFHRNDIDAELSRQFLAGLREALAKTSGHLTIQPCQTVSDVLAVWNTCGAQALVPGLVP